MDNQIKRITPILLACLVVLLTQTARAQLAGRGTSQTGSSGDEFTINPGEEVLVRKRPGLFRRPAKRSPSAQLAYATNLEQQGRERAARNAYRDLVHQWHDAPEAIPAQTGFADMLQAGGKYSKAFKEYQYLFDFYAGRFAHNRILEKQLAIANETAARGSDKKAVDMYMTLVENAPKWEHAPRCQLLAASILESEKDYDDAILAYEELLVRYATSAEMASATYGYARTLSKLADRYPRNERYSWSALSAVETFIARYPEHPDAVDASIKLQSLKDRLAEMYYKRAYFYDRRQKPKAAIITYTEFLRNFGLSERADQVRERIKELKAKEDTDVSNNS